MDDARFESVGPATRVRVAGPGEHAVLTMSGTVAPFLAVGFIAIVAGGLVAAVSRPLGWGHGSWTAAFLVLVTGVGQIGLGIGQAAFGPVTNRRRVVTELLCVNVGATLVIAGTVLGAKVFATTGSLLFAAALAVFARGVSGAGGGSDWLNRAFVALLVLLMASVPVGIALTWLR